MKRYNIFNIIYIQVVGVKTLRKDTNLKILEVRLRTVHIAVIIVYTKGKVRMNRGAVGIIQTKRRGPRALRKYFLK